MRTPRRARVSTAAPLPVVAVALALLPGTLGAEPLEWSSWQLPTPRSDFVAGYDPIGNRYLIYSGFPWNGETWALSVGGNPSWSLLSDSPFHRSDCLSAYDAAANRLFVFGGNEDGYSYQAIHHWALATNTWTGYSASGSIPPTFGNAEQRGSAYDATRNRYVILGSLQDGSSYVFDPATGIWTEKTNTGAVPPATGAAIYDPVRDRFITPGIDGTCEVTPDTFEWSVISPWEGGYPVYDALRDRMLTVAGGGIVKAMSLADPPVWTTLWGTALPGVPTGYAVVHDTGADRLIVHGTGSATWAFSLATNTWSPIFPGSPLETRYDHTTVLVRPWNALVNYGSQFTATGPISKFMLDGAGFQMYASGNTPPLARQAHTAIYDPVRGRMVIFGGHNGSGGYFQDVWAMYTGAIQIWSQLNPLGTLPAKRSNVESVYDPVRDRMLVFGGSNGTVASFRDLWALSLPAPPTRPTWTLLHDNGMPEQMPALVPGSAAMVYDSRRDRVVVLGTEQSSSLLKAWACPLTGPPAWTPLAGSSSERVAFDAAYDSLNDRVLVFGGRNVAGTSITNELTALSFPAETWSALSVPNGPAGRHSHTFVHDAANGRFIVMGGREASTDPSAVWYLNDRGAQLLDVPPGPIASGLALASCRLVSGNRVQVAMDLPEAGALTLEVFDLLGRRWGRAEEPVSAAGRREVTVALDRAATPGLYFIRALQGARTARGKLVVVF